MEKTKIESKKISVFYGEKKALSGISLDIPEKRVTSLIGPSGCGKSTFLRCLNRMNDTIDICRIEGEIFIDDKNIYEKSLDPVLLRARIGMVFQKPNPFPKSIFENVAYGPKIHGIVNSKDELNDLVKYSLKKAGLYNEVKDRLDDPGPSLSARVSQQTAFFHMGNLIEVGKTEEIFSMPKQVKTQDYITGKIG